MRRIGIGILTPLFFLVILFLRSHTNYIHSRINDHSLHIVLSGQEIGSLVENNELSTKSINNLQNNETIPISADGRFSVIIVTFNEPLLYKTYHEFVDI